MSRPEVIERDGISVKARCPLCGSDAKHDHSEKAWAEWIAYWDSMDYQPEEGPQPIVSSDGYSTRFYCTSDSCFYHLNQGSGKKWLCANPEGPHVWERDAAYRWTLIGEWVRS